MSIPKWKDFEDYNNYPSESNPTSNAQMQEFMKNQNELVKEVASMLWQPQTAYVAGQFVFSENIPKGAFAVCTTAGTTGTTEPSWSAVGSNTNDSGVVWNIRKLNSDYNALVNKPTALKNPQSLTLKVNGENKAVYDGSTSKSVDINVVTTVNGEGPDENGNVDMSGLSVGMIIPYAGNGDMPVGFLLCNGASVLRATYPDLFDAIGTTFGATDNTHFNLPDLRQRFIEGGDSAGATGGEAEHTLTVDEIPRHGHNVKLWNTNNTGQTAKEWNGSGTETQVAGSGGRLGSVSWQSSSFKTAGDDWGFGDPMGATTPTGGGQPHNNLPPYTTMRYIIKAFRGAGESVTDLEITELANQINSLTSLPCNGSVLNTKLTFNNGTELWVD